MNARPLRKLSQNHRYFHHFLMMFSIHPQSPHLLKILSKSSQYHWFPHNSLGISTQFIPSFHLVKLVKKILWKVWPLQRFSYCIFQVFFIMKTLSKLYGNIGLLQHLSKIFFIFLYSFTLWKILWKPYRNVLQDFQPNFLIVCSGFSHTKNPNKFL